MNAAHLRSRGEHRPTNPARAVCVGSPPLARRALLRDDVLRPLERLTSARAESTVDIKAFLSQVPAHLRSRGEHRTADSHAVPFAGSPPLARRAPGVKVSAAVSRSAHLRSRGEHS